MRVKTPAARVPQSREEADALLARLGVLVRDRQVVQAAHDEAVAAAKAKAEREAAPIDAEIAEATRLIQAWAEANRSELTKGGRTKTVKMPAGVLCWRAGRARLVVRDEQGAIDHLFKAGKTNFIATKVSLDKAALLKAPDVVEDVPGIEIALDDEQFVAEPVAQPLAGAAA
jgi:phage host-nuclease inhibitor protein Gam